MDWEKGEGHAFPYFVFAASCSEVEIDCLTGDHKVSPVQKWTIFSTFLLNHGIAYGVIKWPSRLLDLDDEQLLRWSNAQPPNILKDKHREIVICISKYLKGINNLPLKLANFSNYWLNQIRAYLDWTLLSSRSSPADSGEAVVWNIQVTSGWGKLL